PGNGLTQEDTVPLRTIRWKLGESREPRPPDAPIKEARTRGAKLFLFDVTRTPDQVRLNLSESARWFPGDSLFGILRFSWQGQTSLTSSEIPADASLAATLHTALQRAVTLEQ